MRVVKVMQRLPGQNSKRWVECEKYYYEGYIYHRDKRSKKKRFTCGAKSTAYQCGVRAFEDDNGNVKLSGQHWHLPSNVELKQPAINKIKHVAVTQPCLPADDIVDQIYDE